MSGLRASMEEVREHKNAAQLEAEVFARRIREFEVDKTQSQVDLQVQTKRHEDQLAKAQEDISKRVRSCVKYFN